MQASIQVIQSIIHEFWKWDKNIIPPARKVSLFFPKLMHFKSNTALGYDIAWDDTLTEIFHIFRYSPSPIHKKDGSRYSRMDQVKIVEDRL